MQNGDCSGRPFASQPPSIKLRALLDEKRAVIVLPGMHITRTEVQEVSNPIHYPSLQTDQCSYTIEPRALPVREGEKEWFGFVEI